MSTFGMATDIGAANTPGSNPDSVLFVKFFDTPMDNAFKSRAEGRPVKEMRTMVHIETPGNQLSVIETFALPHHQVRFPREWAHYLNTKDNGGSGISGTVLADWQAITAAQAEELKHFKFYTVEQIAGASDAQINSIGMLAGMAPHAFRERARLFLKQAEDASLVEHQDAKIKEQSDLMAKMQEQIEQLLSSIPDPEPKPKKRKGDD